MHRLLFPIAFTLLMTGCAHKPQAPALASAVGAPPGLTPFSSLRAGGQPSGWTPLHILRSRKPTDYMLVPEEAGVVLQAHAEDASSALMHDLDVDPTQQPWLQWTWKIKAATLDGISSPAERGSPVRIVLGFDGDKDALPFAEQIKFETAKLVTGHDFPYATLMYVWAENMAPGTVVHSRHSSRIRMVVADSGIAGVGAWRQFARNIVEDFERAFGEPPGRLMGVGVLTDSNLESESTQAWYGDISLMRERPRQLAEPRSQRLPLVLSQGQ